MRGARANSSSPQIAPAATSQGLKSVWFKSPEYLAKKVVVGRASHKLYDPRWGVRVGVIEQSPLDRLAELSTPARWVPYTQTHTRVCPHVITPGPSLSC